MTVPSPASPADDAERLLRSLTGIISAHVVADHTGRIVEIHILAEPEIQPKRVVRNVESALGAGLGIEIDRRIVSVAQVGEDAEPLPELQQTQTPRPHPSGNVEPRPAGQLRYEFVRYSSRREVALETTCEVTLRHGNDEFRGTGKGADTPQGRADAAARAVFQALAAARDDDELGFDAALLAETRGQTFVIVSARAHDGRDATPLAGAARLTRSPEEAAILASLQATNRWNDPLPLSG